MRDTVEMAGLLFLTVLGMVALSWAIVWVAMTADSLPVVVLTVCLAIAAWVIIVWLSARVAKQQGFV